MMTFISLHWPYPPLSLSLFVFPFLSFPLSLCVQWAILVPIPDWWYAGPRGRWRGSMSCCRCVSRRPLSWSSSWAPSTTSPNSPGQWSVAALYSREEALCLCLYLVHVELAMCIALIHCATRGSVPYAIDFSQGFWYGTLPCWGC